MLQPRYRRYVQSFLLVLPMTGLVTAINTALGRGVESVFTAATLGRWMISLAIAFPAVLFIAPLAQRLTNKLVKSD